MPLSKLISTITIVTAFLSTTHVSSGQTLLDLQRQSKNANFSNFSLFLPPIGTTLPSTCLIGQVFFKTNAAAGSNLYGCTAANTWSQQAGGGGGSVTWPTSGYLVVSNSSNTPAGLQPTTNGYCLIVTGGAWAAGACPGGSPGGTNGQIQYNNSGAFGGISTTGSGNAVLATSPVLVAPALGTPSALVLTNATGLPGGQITGANSVPASTLPLATTGAFGAVKPDGTSITITSGVISATGVSAGVASLASGSSGAISCTGTGTPATGAVTCDVVTSVVPLKANANVMTGSNQFSQPVLYSLNTVSSSATPVFNLTLGKFQTTTLTANITSFTISGLAANGEWCFDFVQNGTGSFTISSPPAAFHGLFTIGSTASKHNVQCFYSPDGTNLYAESAGQTNQ